MAYYKRVIMDVREAVAEEVAKGFETFDEMLEVFNEIASEYQIGTDYVWEIYHDMDVKAGVDHG